MHTLSEPIIKRLSILRVSSFQSPASASIFIRPRSLLWCNIFPLRLNKASGRSPLIYWATGLRTCSLARSPMACAIGPIVAPVIGGYLTQHFGWRAPITALGLYGCTVLALLLALPETHP